MRHGYVRVSIKEQNIDKKMATLLLEHIAKNQILLIGPLKKILIGRNTTKYNSSTNRW